MALHSGLLWLADGFEKYDNLADASTSYNDLHASGDSNYCKTNVSHKLNLAEAKINQKSKPTKPCQSASNAKVGTTPRPRSAVLRRNNNTQQLYSSHVRSRVSRNNLTARNKHNGNFRAPTDLSPRTGAWTSKPATEHGVSFGGDRHYQELPDHPDLRYFDRHNRCFNNTHCGVSLRANRPQTACDLGRRSLQQCECCGEITSKICYRYAPTGSAMTANHGNNKTFLYPERIMVYDAYTGRQRPSSAPGRSASHGRPLPPNYLVRGDIPHFCNFVTPCSVYDKVTGDRLLDNKELELFELFYNYGKENCSSLLDFGSVKETYDPVTGLRKPDRYQLNHRLPKEVLHQFASAVQQRSSLVDSLKGRVGPSFNRRAGMGSRKPINRSYRIPKPRRYSRLDMEETMNHLREQKKKEVERTRRDTMRSFNELKSKLFSGIPLEYEELKSSTDSDYTIVTQRHQMAGDGKPEQAVSQLLNSELHVDSQGHHLPPLNRESSLESDEQYFRMHKNARRRNKHVKIAEMEHATLEQYMKAAAELAEFGDGGINEQRPTTPELVSDFKNQGKVSRDASQLVLKHYHSLSHRHSSGANSFSTNQLYGSYRRPSLAQPAQVTFGGGVISTQMSESVGTYQFFGDSISERGPGNDSKLSSEHTFKSSRKSTLISQKDASTKVVKIVFDSKPPPSGRSLFKSVAQVVRFAASGNFASSKSPRTLAVDNNQFGLKIRRISPRPSLPQETLPKEGQARASLSVFHSNRSPLTSALNIPFEDERPASRSLSEYGYSPLPSIGNIPMEGGRQSSLSIINAAHTPLPSIGNMPIANLQQSSYSAFPPTRHLSLKTPPSSRRGSRSVNKRNRRKMSHSPSLSTGNKTNEVLDETASAIQRLKDRSDTDDSSISTTLSSISPTRLVGKDINGVDVNGQFKDGEKLQDVEEFQPPQFSDDPYSRGPYMRRRSTYVDDLLDLHSDSSSHQSLSSAGLEELRLLAKRKKPQLDYDERITAHSRAYKVLDEIGSGLESEDQVESEEVPVVPSPSEERQSSAPRSIPNLDPLDRAEETSSLPPYQPVIPTKIPSTSSKFAASIRKLQFSRLNLSSTHSYDLPKADDWSPDANSVPVTEKSRHSTKSDDSIKVSATDLVTESAAKSVNNLKSIGGSSEKIVIPDDALSRIRSDRISVVNIGAADSKRKMNSTRKRPPSASVPKKDDKVKETPKPSTRKKKGLFDKESSETLIASEPSPPIEEELPVESEPPVALEPEPPVVTALEPPPSTSPLPPSSSIDDSVEEKRKHLRKVGAGRGDEDEYFDIDFSKYKIARRRHQQMAASRLDTMMRLRRDSYSTKSNAPTAAAASAIPQVRSPLKMQAWMNGRLALSKKSSRFELPIDMMLLEKMTPLQYLSRYCVVTSRRRMLYDKIFNKYKSIYTSKLGFQELQKALSDVLIQSIDEQKMKLVIQMLLIDEELQIDKKLFYGISAFAERLLYPIFARGGDQHSTENQKEKIESADFYALKWKFHGVDVNSAIRDVLEVL